LPILAIEGSWTGVKLQTPIRLRSKDKISLYVVHYMLLKDSLFHPMFFLLNYCLKNFSLCSVFLKKELFFFKFDFKPKSGESSRSDELLYFEAEIYAIRFNKMFKIQIQEE
jgi:hypothetical protein